MYSLTLESDFFIWITVHTVLNVICDVTSHISVIFPNYYDLLDKTVHDYSCFER